MGLILSHQPSNGAGLEIQTEGKKMNTKLYAVALNNDGLPVVQDQLVMRGGCLRCLYSNQTVEEMGAEQGRTIHVMLSDQIHLLIRGHYCAIPPERITEEQYQDALDALPPENWGRQVIKGQEIETFAFEEYLHSDITTIYARVKGEHWSLLRPADTSRMEIFLDILHKTGRSKEEKKAFFA
jgi:hypothetical protein